MRFKFSVYNSTLMMAFVYSFPVTHEASRPAVSYDKACNGLSGRDREPEPGI